MAFCNNCGTQLNDGAKFCAKCGNAVAQTPPVQPQQASANTSIPQGANQNVAEDQVSPPKTPPLQKEDVKKRNFIAAICVFIGLVICIGAVIFYRMKESKAAALDLLVQGNNLSTEGKFDEAIQAYTGALAKDENLAEAYGERGDAYFVKGDYDRAIADYTEFLRIYPHSPQAYNSRGHTYGYKGDHDRAIADFNEALRINPNYAEAYNNRGNAYLQKGDFDRVIADCTEALRINPDYVDAYGNRGFAYANKGDLDRAIADWEAILRIDPNQTFAQENINTLVIPRLCRGDYRSLTVTGI